MDDQPAVTGIVIKADGTYKEQVFKQLSDYQEAVGGFIETVRLFDAQGNDYATAYVNEEGLLIGAPLNYFASGLSFILGNQPTLVGNVIILGKGDGNGYDTNIPQELLAFIYRILPEWKAKENESKPV